MSTVTRVRHFATVSRDAAAEIDFHETVLGLRLVGRRPVRAHGAAAERLDFAPQVDGASAVVSVICLGPDGSTGRLGSNGPRSANFAVPLGTLDYWEARLWEHHVRGVRVRHLDSDRLEFAHPEGVTYALVAADAAAGSPAVSGGPVPAERAITGLHGVTISLMDVREAHAFLVDLLGAKHAAQDLEWGLYQFDGQEGTRGIELLHEPYRAPGTWAYAVGTPHHIALDVISPEGRAQLRRTLLDAGYLDVAPTADEEQDSLWFRAAGGTLIDLTCCTATQG